jgi:hypothetical protein
MGRTFLKPATLLIALYLGVRYASGAGTLFTQGASGVSKVVKTFQGR